MNEPSNRKTPVKEIGGSLEHNLLNRCVICMRADSAQFLFTRQLSNNFAPKTSWATEET